MALLTFAPLSDLGVGQAWVKEPIHSRFIDNSRGSIKEIDPGIIYIYNYIYPYNVYILPSYITMNIAVAQLEQAYCCSLTPLVKNNTI